jgi:hypothetical protein
LHSRENQNAELLKTLSGEKNAIEAIQQLVCKYQEL